MVAVAYDRARKLWSPRQGSVLQARVLGVVYALLVLILFSLGGLLAALATTRGGIRPGATRADAKTVVTPNLPASSGLSPIVAANQGSPAITHRLAARLVDFALRVVPPLGNNAGALAVLVASALTVAVAVSGVTQARRLAIATASHEVAVTLRRQIHRQMYRLGESSLPGDGTGPILSLFTREVNDVRDGVIADLTAIPQVPVLFAGLLLFALGISWSASVALVTLGVLLAVSLRVLNRSAELASVVATRESALQLCLLQEDFGLIRTVRVHGMENVDKQRFDHHLEAYGEAEIRRMIHEPKVSPTAALVIAVAVILAAGFLAANVILVGLSPASALLMALAVVAMVRPTLDWFAYRRSVSQADRSAGGIFAYLERKPELHQAGGAMFLPPLKERLSFENVTLESRSGRTLLDGLTVEIPAGKKTSILALDEEAKHALVCLIPRLIDPKVGRVRIDGIDLRDATLESVRAQVATVLQSDLVFSDTVVANIALGDPSYDLPRVIQAAKMAHAHHFIAELPLGYDTPIGPLGDYLKPDQQYRIALARAYLHDPSIVIIEEPTSPLDEDVKAYVDDTVARLAPGRTLIMLPHRLSTIRSSDRVVLLHNGRLETTGTPREVSHDSKLYRHLQYIEFNQFATGEIEVGHFTA